MSLRLAFACLLLATGLPAPAHDAGRQPWIVATYAYPQRDRRAAIQPLADYLARRGQHPVRVELFPTPTALVDALRNGRVDVAVPNLHAYLQTRPWRERDATLPVPQVPPAQADRYRAVLVAGGGIGSLAMLKREAGRLRLVLVGRDSASGGFVPAQYLREQGLEPARGFASLAYAGSHAAALQEVAAGRADLAALAADVYDAAHAEGLVELWRSAPIPPGPLLCRPGPGVPCTHIAAWLLEAHDRDPAVMAALRAGWPEFGDATRFAPAAAGVQSMALPAE